MYIDPAYLIQSAKSGLYADWASVVVPAIEIERHGEDLEFVTDGGEVFPMVKHRSKGKQGISYRICMPFVMRLACGSVRKATRPHGIEKYRSAESVIGIKPPEPVGLSLRRTDIVERSEAEIVERFAYSSQKETVIVWRRRRHLHPVVDYGVRWSRRYDDGWMPSVVIPGVEAMHLMPGHDWEDVVVAGNTVRPPNLVDGRCAPTVWLRATYPADGPESPIEQQLRSTVSDPWPVGIYEKYQHYAVTDAKDMEPIVVGDAEWLTLGIVPHESLETVINAVEPDRVAKASIYDKRIGAQALSANQAGTQRFGCAEGGAVLKGRPHEAMNYMRQMAGDEELRPIHYYEADGAVLDPRGHLSLRTHNRRIDWRNSQDRLWFNAEPPRITTAGKRTTDDEQHMDDLGIDAYLAVFDDPALEETRRFMIRLDAMDTQTLSGRTNSAARGVGRPLLSAANAAWLFHGTDDGILAEANCDLIVNGLASTWEGKSVPLGRPERVIRPVKTLKGVASWNLRNPDTGEPMRAAAPYEHATVVAGLLASMRVLKNAVTKQVALGLFDAVGQTLLSWRFNEILDGFAEWPFIIACLEGEEDGFPLPAEWKNPDSPKFTSTHITGGSWTTWTMPGVMAIRTRHPLPEDVQDKVDCLLHDSIGNPLVSRFTAIAPSLRFDD